MELPPWILKCQHKPTSYVSPPRSLLATPTHVNEDQPLERERDKQDVGNGKISPFPWNILVTETSTHFRFIIGDTKVSRSPTSFIDDPNHQMGIHILANPLGTTLCGSQICRFLRENLRIVKTQNTSNLYLDYLPSSTFSASKGIIP